MKALPGSIVDLISCGVPLKNVDRGDVLIAVRRVMLSAHNCGVPYHQVAALLTDRQRELAEQIRFRADGLPHTQLEVERLLRKQWDDTAQIAARVSAWTAGDVPDLLDQIRKALDDDPSVADDDRAVLTVVLDLGLVHNHTQPAAPWREVSALSGLGPWETRQTLRRLCDQRQWIRLAKRGNSVTRRANLYSVTPAIRRLGLWPPAPDTSIGRGYTDIRTDRPKDADLRTDPPDPPEPPGWPVPPLREPNREAS